MGAAVQPVYLFDLAFQRSQWLSVRQSAIAENIANVNTPSYRARDVEPFETVLDKTELAMAATQLGHICAEARRARRCDARSGARAGTRQPRQ